VPFASIVPVGVTVIETNSSLGGGTLAAVDELPQPFAAMHTATKQAIARTNRYRFGMQIKLLVLRESSPGVKMKTSHVFLLLILTDIAN